MTVVTAFALGALAFVWWLGATGDAARTTPGAGAARVVQPRAHEAAEVGEVWPAAAPIVPVDDPRHASRGDDDVVLLEHVFYGADRDVTWTFTGRVLDEHGAPLPGASIAVVADAYTAASRGFTARPFESLSQGEASGLVWFGRARADGRFTVRAPLAFRGLRSRTHRGDPLPGVVVGARGYAPSVLTVYAVIDEQCDMGDVALRPGAHLRGRVVDEDGRPFAGVLVRALGRSSLAAWFTTALHDDFCATLQNTHTDRAGRFAIADLEPESISLLLSAPGYPVHRRQDVVLAAGATTEVGDVVIPGGRTLVARVVNPAGAPLAGVEVFVLPDALEADGETLSSLWTLGLAGNADAESDASGRFELRGLDGDAAVALLRPEWKPSLASADRELYALEPLERVLLSVVDAASREPVAEARVVRAVGSAERFLGSARAFGPFKAVRPPTEDEVAIGPVSPTHVVECVALDDLELTVAAQGYESQSWSWSGVAAPEERPIHLVLELRPEAVISGRVVALSGAPIAGAEVGVTGPDIDIHNRVAGPQPWPYVVETAADGTYRVGALGDAEYELWVAAPGHAPAHAELSLRPGQELAGVDFTLAPGGRLRGTVKRHDGSPAAFLHASLQGPEDRLRPVRTDGAGRYALGDLAAGTWCIEVDAAGPTSAVLPPGGEVVLDLVLKPPPAIEGIVVDAAGEPVARAQFWTGATTHPENWAATDVHSGDDGRFQLTGVSDRVRYVRATTRGGGHSAPAVVAPAWGEVVRVTLTLGGGSLEVTLVDASQDGPAAELDVRLVVEAIRRWSGAPAFPPVEQSAGHAVFRALTAGSYRLVIHDPGGRLADERRTLVLRDAEHAHVRVELHAAGRISGAITDADGAPISKRSAVTLRKEGDREVWDRTIIERDGTFAFDRIGPGTWTVSSGRTDAVKRTVTLAPGETRSVELVVDHPDDR